MFDQLVVSGAKGIKTNKPWTVVLSGCRADSRSLGILVLIPLIYTEALDPRACSATFLVAPPPPPPPPPPPAIVKTVKAPKIVQISKMVAPTVIPKTVSIVKDEAPVIYSNNAAGVDGGTGSGILAAFWAMLLRLPEARRSATHQDRRTGRGKAPFSIRTTPEYPADRESGAHLGNGCFARHHREGRLHSGIGVHFRASDAGEIRDGCRKAVAL